mgnify:CR=1 FL=1
MPYDLHLHFIDRIVRTNADSLDLTSKHLTKQQECGDLEQDTLECLEAYGARRGHKLCKEFLDDYTECMFHFMQVSFFLSWKTYQILFDRSILTPILFISKIQKERSFQMKRERLKQVMRGERKPLEVFDPIKPPRDSYQSGPFYN